MPSSPPSKERPMLYFHLKHQLSLQNVSEWIDFAEIYAKYQKQYLKRLNDHEMSPASTTLQISCDFLFSFNCTAHILKKSNLTRILRSLTFDPSPFLVNSKICCKLNRGIFCVEHTCVPPTSKLLKA